MELIAPPKARAYVYAGDWVADCVRLGCGGTEHLFDRSSPRGPRTVRRGSFFCSYCKAVAPVEWPTNTGEIMGVLNLRPIPHTRNWYPSGHETAVKLRLEDGQTIQNLRDENAEHGIV